MIFLGVCDECKVRTWESTSPNRKYCEDCAPLVKFRQNREALARAKQDYASVRMCRRCKVNPAPGQAWYCDTCKPIVRTESWKRHNEGKMEDKTVPLVKEETLNRLIVAMIHRCPRNEGCHDCIVQDYCHPVNFPVLNSSLGTAV